MHQLTEAKSKCDIVVDRLLSMIVNKQFDRGDKLPTERELGEMFGVSRITIRESLKKLEIMGMVSIQQGKGTFVKEIDLGTFMQPVFNLIDFGDFDIATIYESRVYIETGTCRLAAKNRTEEEIAKLRENIEEQRLAIQNKEFERLAEIDSRFHIGIASASKNQILRAAVINLENISAACAKKINKSHAVLENALQHHTLIVDAIERQDADEAERGIVEHTLKSQELLQFKN